MSFRLISGYKATGDQPQAIEKLVTGINNGQKQQVLLGVTGSGKTFTVANVIEKINKPTLVIAHNKTLAAQLYQEFKEFFPHNSVNYFVSYYDFYQPEAYIPQTDTYIEKETDINEEIDKLRLQTTANLLSRNDVIVVASVSCIYNLGSPEEYGNATLSLRGSEATKQSSEKIASHPLAMTQREIIERLIDLQYIRNEYDFKRGTFRVVGENIDIYPAYEDFGVRVNNKITKIDPLTGKKLEELKNYVVFPAKHFMTSAKNFTQIKLDLEEQCKKLPLLEAQRLKSRVTYDLEMIQEVGYVNGIENYSRYFDGRKEGDPPYSLLEYFGKDYLLIIDESHMTIPQIRGMYNGDRSRKQTLIDFGFRLPAALDNRPLRFEEFQRRQGTTIYTSATPDEWEISQSDQIVEQLVRPTGLVDPQVEIRKSEGQIDDLISEIEKRVEKHERVLVTTLTKRMAEELTDYLNKKYAPVIASHEVAKQSAKNAAGKIASSQAPRNDTIVKVAYLHSDVENIKRTDILKKLRQGEFDVLIGINLLREGLDLPEVSLVAILDADKEGFLRSKTSLVQTMGRAARHVNGQVIMYADNVTKSMEAAISEINRRRKYQLNFNKKNNIIPTSINKPIRENILMGKIEKVQNIDFSQMTPQEKSKLKKLFESRMREAAKILDFEGAAEYRDKLKELV